MNRQDVFRRLLKARAFTRLYGSIIGAASAEMFSEPLQHGLLDHLPSGARVLEVGCGPGLQAIALNRLRPDLELIASDFSAEFIELSRRNAAEASIQFVVADAMDLSQFPSASFDGVYSMTAIKHFPDPVRGLRECLRVLKPGGRLVVAEIRRESSRDEVRSLVELFRVPSWLKRPMTQLVHGTLRDECPPLDEVQRWLAELGASAVDPSVQALPGRPAWVASLRAA
jgi:ubiquinone/menaquinone biosynthesis C-methylase UbiE